MVAGVIVGYAIGGSNKSEPVRIVNMDGPKNVRVLPHDEET